MVGLVNLRITSRLHRTAKLGFGIRRDLWGRGFGSEAAYLLVDFGFRNLGCTESPQGIIPTTSDPAGSSSDLA